LHIGLLQYPIEDNKLLEHNTRSNPPVRRTDEVRAVVRAAFTVVPGEGLRVSLEPLKNWMTSARRDEGHHGWGINHVDRLIRHVERVRIYRVEERREYAQEAAHREEGEARRLGRRLLAIDCGPGCEGSFVRGLCGMKDPGPVSDDEIAGLVARLEATAAGCRWLAEGFAAIRECFGGQKNWLPEDAFTLIRLMGRKPLDALEVPEVAEVLLASHAFDRSRRNAFGELSNKLGFRATRELVLGIAKYAKSTFNFDDAKQGRQAMAAILDRATARLEAKSEEHLRNASREDVTTALGLEFDSTPKGKKLAYQEREYSRLLRRTFDTVRNVLQLAEEQKEDGRMEPARTKTPGSPARGARGGSCGPGRAQKGTNHDERSDVR
jgi:hypothetical protein